MRITLCHLVRNLVTLNWINFYFIGIWQQNIYFIQSCMSLQLHRSSCVYAVCKIDHCCVSNTDTGSSGCQLTEASVFNSTIWYLTHCTIKFNNGRDYCRKVILWLVFSSRYELFKQDIDKQAINYFNFFYLSHHFSFIICSCLVSAQL